MDRRPLVLGLVVVSVVVGGWWTTRAEPAPPPLIEVTAGPAALEAITVHVAGAVVNPGVVTVPVGSRVVDAVSAAGGLTRDSRTDVVNLAAPVRDGDHIVIPLTGEGAALEDGRVRINTADAADLETLPGVGPVLADRIVAHRDANGPFTEAEDLLDVPGIGEAKLASLRDSLVVP
ncbi:MAG: ComEA family DNA-binding protein [Acidimicrobiia bacterium]|nr:ComEA family DNA-binding protein [Acidimicrobiia bacterium]